MHTQLKNPLWVSSCIVALASLSLWASSHFSYSTKKASFGCFNLLFGYHSATDFRDLFRIYSVYSVLSQVMRCRIMDMPHSSRGRSQPYSTTFLREIAFDFWNTLTKAWLNPIDLRTELTTLTKADPRGPTCTTISSRVLISWSQHSGYFSRIRPTWGKLNAPGVRSRWAWSSPGCPGQKSFI